MPGRSLYPDSYRYSINGQEKTPEIAPNTTTAEFWQYDARIVRRWNVDPRSNISISPYNCFAGNPIWMADPFGDTTINGQKMEGRNAASATYLQNVTVISKPRTVKPNGQGGNAELPLGEVTSILLDKNKEAYKRINEARDALWKQNSYAGGPPRTSNKLDGKLLKNLAGRVLLEALDKTFTAIDFAQAGLDYANGKTIIPLPIVGIVVNSLVDDLVDETDRNLFEDLIGRRGYSGFSAYASSTAQGRHQFAGVFVNKETMLQIINAGELDLKTQNVINTNGWYPRDIQVAYETNPDTFKYKPDYFILFNSTKETKITNFGVLPLSIK